MKIKLVEFDGKICAEFKCPGCGDTHSLPINPHKNASGAGWNFNGDTEKPTLTPSILSKCGPITDPEYRVNDKGWDSNGMKICHSFVTEGRIRFLSDCTHDLKDQTVDLLDI